jgi:recombinational DNA repair protein RecR
MYTVKINIEIERMWINQPSTQQRYHEYHGQNVLAVFRTGETEAMAYFLSEPLISMNIDISALSSGWR